VIQATLVLAFAYCAIHARPRRSSADRHVSWAAALGAAAVLPLLSVALGTWQPPWARTVAEYSRPCSHDVAGVAGGEDICIHAAWRTRRSMIRVAVIWIAGASVALPTLLRERAARAIRSLARPVMDNRGSVGDVCARFEIAGRSLSLQSPAVHIPMTWGVRRLASSTARRLAVAN
jgi:hypothetical protein